MKRALDSSALVALMRKHIPGALRTQTLGPVVTAIARVADEEQLSHIRNIPGARIQVYPLTLEEVFVALFRENAPDQPLVPDPSPLTPRP